MRKIFLVSVLMLLCVTTAMADVTIYIDVSQVGPVDLTTDEIEEKVSKNEQASYSLAGSYNGLPTMNAEEKVTGESWSYTISSGSDVTCNPKSGSSESATFTALSGTTGTYTITITMELILTITKYKSDMTTVVSTRESEKYSKTTTVTLDVWGRLRITMPEYLPVNSVRYEVTVTIDDEVAADGNTTPVSGNITLTATDKLLLYQNSTDGTGSNSLTLPIVDNKITCYIAAGDTPSNNASDQNLTATHDTPNTEPAKKDATVYELKIEAPGKMVNIGGGNFTVPVMFNDDHDCGLEYTANWKCSEYCPEPSQCKPADLHRELEPVWDNMYIGKCDKEDDLVAFKVEIKPTDMAGDVTVKLLTSNIRIWKQSNKGDRNSIITEKIYSVSELPKTLYIEGIKAELEKIGIIVTDSI
ncbi:MAG: hypothetical protein LBT09_00655 [Planctomycetaceae bacterium]|jgi:hypothetical protein|nr:hypothetical protein [Planctomycetaceae bacterium]